MYYPDSLPISKMKKYSDFHINANKKLSQYITQRIFKSWKEQVQKVVNFKKNRNNGLLQDIISFWKQYTTKKMIERSKLNQFSAQIQSNLLKNTFKTLQQYL